MALMMSLVALSIDGMLPALPAIRNDLVVVNENEIQLIIFFLFLGLSLGQIFYGPLSDTTGRKPVIYVGLMIFCFGCLLSIISSDLQIMLAGRLLQGLGLAVPRVISMAIIRDLFEGKAMARVMSFIIVVFILVPTVAPAIRQIILIFFNWKIIFVFFLFLGLVVLVWFTLRSQETLSPEKRVPFGMLIGLSYDGTVMPVIYGFTVFGTLSLGVVHRVETRNKKT